MKNILKTEILIESEFSGELEIINGGSIENSQTITNHLNKDFKIRITTERGEMIFSGMNAWAEIAEFYYPEKLQGFLGYVEA